jgi:hypothetical protein
MSHLIARPPLDPDAYDKLQVRCVLRCVLLACCLRAACLCVLVCVRSCGSPAAAATSRTRVCLLATPYGGELVGGSDSCSVPEALP